MEPVNKGSAFVAKEVVTNAVDAAFVELSPAEAVGIVTVPVKVGDAKSALLFKLVTVTSTSEPELSNVSVSHFNFP